MSDELKHQKGDVKKKGFGIIPKLVMQDERLSIEAKAIYAYMASYAGAGDTAFPGVSLMIKHLDISQNRFFKHRKSLIECGYISITKVRKTGRMENNIYTLNQTVSPYLQNECMENECMENECMENEGTNSNSIKINSIENQQEETGGASSDLKELSKVYQQVIGQPNGYTAEWLNNLLEAYGFEWSKEAMVAAEKQGKRSKAYVEAILQRWKTGGGMQKAGDKKPVIKEDRRARESLWGKYSDLMANY